MVEIISRPNGPRREDAEVRRLIEDNRATINRLADHISGGSYSAGRKPRPEPKAEGLIFHVVGYGRKDEAKPAIRVSLNGRVVAVDENSGRQLHHIGDIRRLDGCDTFLLATKANRFFAPVEEPIAAALADLDGRRLDNDYGEETLASEISRSLGMT